MKSTNWSGKITFVNPKTLLSWARQAAQDFRRADAYCSRWWDPNSKSPKKSGDTENDVHKKIDCNYLFVFDPVLEYQIT